MSTKTEISPRAYTSIHLKYSSLCATSVCAFLTSIAEMTTKKESSLTQPLKKLLNGLLLHTSVCPVWSLKFCMKFLHVSFQTELLFVI